MPKTSQSTTHSEQYQRAVQSTVEALKQDGSILAVLQFVNPNNVAWEKSVPRLLAIARDDKSTGAAYHITVGTTVVELSVCGRTDFATAIKAMNTPQIGGCGDSLPLPPGGEILYCEDESMRELLEDMTRVGKADMERALLPRACDMLKYLNKAEEYVSAYENPTHARFYILEFAKSLAEFELCINYMEPSEEPILQAATMNPALMQRFYEFPMNNALDSDAVLALIAEAYAYIDSHLSLTCKRLLRFLTTDGEPVRVSDVSDEFRANVIYVTEYLSEKGILDRVSMPIPVTEKGRQIVDEVAYIYQGGE